MLKALDAAGKVTWVSNIKNVLLSNGFGNVWIAQGVGDVNNCIRLFRQRVCDIAKQTWLEDIARSTTYSMYKSTLEPELYLSKVEWRRHRVALSRLRTGSNQLAVNRLRGQLPKSERLSKYCKNLNINQVEDEYHFVMVCPLYKEIRNSHLKDVVQNVNTHTFTILMYCTSIMHRLSIFAYHGFKTHNDFMMP